MNVTAVMDQIYQPKGSPASLIGLKIGPETPDRAHHLNFIGGPNDGKGCYIELKAGCEMLDDALEWFGRNHGHEPPDYVCGPGADSVKVEGYGLRYLERPPSEERKPLTIRLTADESARLVACKDRFALGSLGEAVAYLLSTIPDMRRGVGLEIKSPKRAKRSGRWLAEIRGVEGHHEHAFWASGPSEALKIAKEWALEACEVECDGVEIDYLASDCHDGADAAAAGFPALLAPSPEGRRSAPVRLSSAADSYGRVSVRSWQRKGGFPTAEAARRSLQQMADSGAGHWMRVKSRRYFIPAVR